MITDASPEASAAIVDQAIYAPLFYGDVNGVLHPFITLYSPVDLAMHKKLVHNYMPGPEGAAEDNMVWLWWCDAGHC